MSASYAIGIDYGTNTVRAVVVDTRSGEMVGTGVKAYSHGQNGVVLDERDPHVARQHPVDHVDGLIKSVRAALADADIDPAAVVGMGVDATGSTPIPVDGNGKALAFDPEYVDHPAALAWLWKDHTSVAEAVEISEHAAKTHPEYLAKCGGAYSSEWFWAKILHCSRVAPDVFAAAHTWVELSDWIPALLVGKEEPARLPRSLCAAGHKGMFNTEWGGYPDKEFIAHFDEGVLTRVWETLPECGLHIGESVGTLCEAWARRLGLPEGIPVAAGIIDAHAGAVGAGVKPGVMVKIMGTSTCDIAVAPLEKPLPDIPGICGIARESVLPGCYGLEAGQSAVGDIFNWHVQKLMAGSGVTHTDLEREAAQLRPGQSGLLALDWHNGNRSLLTDPELTGLVLGLTLHTTPAEIYRAWVEATAFGARMIIERLHEYGVPIERVINGGGIAAKSPMTMQIYADVLGLPMEIAASDQSCALGAAMAGAVVGGAHPDFNQAAAAMTRVRAESYTPIAENQTAYDRLFFLYKQLHDLFGRIEDKRNAFNVMKALIRCRTTH